ncbi:unnamed protein product [Symbiodinium sp. CCMP2592]|nr:unnamed protein product [Symbiodinium sp. CCMP2592]CAE7314902.1 unnamed protein product [Symbiodinium sp. CCMP2592]CAE7463854.1 unnamed protein product [Symbiodinium sp. CCMP2592]
MVKVARAFPRRTCPSCSGSLVKTITGPRDVSKGVLIGSESLSKTSTRVSRCVRKGCRVYVRHNYMRIAGEKINVLSFNQMKAAGVYFVTTKTAFTMSYLELCYLRLLRAKTSPGQEAAVRVLLHQGHDDLPDHRTFRDCLLRALEAYAVAKRTPDQVVSFNVDYPAKEVVRLSRSQPLLFHPMNGVREVAMDGNFGLHRHLLPGVDPPRTKQLPGRPRKALREDERSCSCARKDSLHLALPQRTAGWQFAVDPSSRKVLAALEHKASESHGDKVRLLHGLFADPQCVPDVLIHDDACHLEAYVRKHHPDSFPSVKHFIVDAFHRRNHKCSKRELTVSQKRRCNRVRTNMSESFNAWIRALNFFVNSLRPHSHAFWIEEACLFYNTNLAPLPTFVARPRGRRNVKARMMKKPAAIRKRPSSRR